MIRKNISLVLAIILAFSCFGGATTFAFDYNYRYAQEFTGTVNETISSANNVDWYKFTLAEADVPCAYSVSLRTPANHLYNFDVRYLAPNSEGRPVILPIESVMSSSRTRRMVGVFDQAGTYYVRVFSQDGTSSTLDTYRLSISYNRDNTYEMMYEDVELQTVSRDDWALCAEMLAKKTLGNEFYGLTIDRNYKNANVFINSAYSEDNRTYYADYANATKPTQDKVAIAADYIYAGDLLLKNKFEAVTGNIYEIEDLMYYLWELNQGVVFYMDYPNLPPELDEYQRYVILRQVNIGENTITVYNPYTNTDVTMDYDEFLTDGLLVGAISVTFRGTSIVEKSYARIPQKVYE